MMFFTVWRWRIVGECSVLCLFFPTAGHFCSKAFRCHLLRGFMWKTDSKLIFSVISTPCTPPGVACIKGYSYKITLHGLSVFSQEHFWRQYNDSLLSTFRVDFHGWKSKSLWELHVSLGTGEPSQITQPSWSLELSPSRCYKFNSRLIAIPWEWLVVSHVVCTVVSWAIVHDCTHILEPNVGEEVHVLLIHNKTNIFVCWFLQIPLVYHIILVPL